MAWVVKKVKGYHGVECKRVLSRKRGYAHGVVVKQEGGGKKERKKAKLS